MARMNKIVWCLIAISLCNGQRILDELIFQTPQPAGNQMSGLIKLCFSERTNPIVITQDLIDTIFGTLRDLDHPNVNVIDHNYKAKQIQIFNRAYPTYILSAKSTDQLEDLLHALKSSPTWSITSVFFIIGTNENSCRNASPMLQILWKMNLISSFYVCYESDNKEIMMLYTYNPFTNRAPEPWVEVESTDKPDDRWTVYKQPYTNNKEACKNLTYDKTKSLDGYGVKAVGNSLSNSNYTRNNKTYDIDSLEEHRKHHQQIMFAKTLFLALNVTPIINYDQPGYWINNTAVGFLNGLMNGTYDISLNPRSRKYISDVDFLNLHYQVRFMILTQRKSIVRTIKNDLPFLNYKIIGVMILILVITFVIIVVHNGRDYGNGFLDIIRISISSGIDAPLDKLPVRVIFLIITLFVYVVSPEIQGQIFSYSTMPERHYPQNLKDLNDFKFNLYYPAYLQDFISEQTANLDLNKTFLRMFSYHPSTCYDQVLNDSSNACLGPVGYQVEAAYDHNLHLAQKKLCPMYLTHWIKKDWALREKMNKVALTFRESGLLNLWDRQQSKYIFKKFKAREILENSGPEYDEITFEHMAGIYLFLALCLVFGILVFVAEIVIAKYKAAQHRRKIIRTLEKRVALVGGRLILIK